MIFDPGDPMLSFVISVISVIISSAGLILAILPLIRKSLTFETLVNEPTLIHVGDDFYVKMTEYLNSKEKKADGLITATDRRILLRMANSGLRNICHDDFDGNIIIDFGETALITNADVVKAKPDNIRYEIKRRTKNISISPLLIKSGESITIGIEVENYQIMYIDARLQGNVKVIEIKNPLKHLILPYLGLAIFTGFGLPFIFSLPIPSTLKTILLLSLFIITSILLVALTKRGILSRYDYE